MSNVKKFLHHFFRKAENSVWENIYLCMAISFACGIFGYATIERNQTILNTMFGNLLFIAVWCYCSYVSGLKKQWGFLIFTGTYFIVPGVYMIYYASRDNLADYNSVLAVLNRISELFFNKPMERIARKLSSSVWALTICLIIIVVAIFFIGFFVNRLKEMSVLKQSGIIPKAESEEDEEDEEEYLDLTGKNNVDYILSEIEMKAEEKKKSDSADPNKLNTGLLFTKIERASENETKPDEDKAAEDKAVENKAVGDEAPEGYEEIYRSIMAEKKNRSR